MIGKHCFFDMAFQHTDRSRGRGLNPRHAQRPHLAWHSQHCQTVSARISCCEIFRCESPKANSLRFWARADRARQRCCESLPALRALTPAKLDGRRAARPAASVQAAVNTVFQHYALFPHLTVEENVGYGLRVAECPEAEIARALQQALAMVKMTALREGEAGEDQWRPATTRGPGASAGQPAAIAAAG